MDIISFYWDNDDEKAYATHKLGQIYGDEKQPGELAYLQQELNEEIKLLKEDLTDELKPSETE